LPFVIQIVAALLLAELCYYWYHRLGHTRVLLWRFHAVHHSTHRV
jgi:sterol desaturase/sphingolipid hydroxylase (fatty acid hydroxylase superfamily)